MVMPKDIAKSGHGREYLKWEMEYQNKCTWEEYLLKLGSEKTMIRSSVEEVKKELGKQSLVGEQLQLSFMPTRLTRTSPFFPMSKLEMKNRPMEEVTFSNPWGQIRIKGERLAIHDESVLLGILILVKKNRDNAVSTSLSELCKLTNVNRGKSTYDAIWNSINRLACTNISTDILNTKTKSKNAPLTRQMTGSIITFADKIEKSNKLNLTVNPYFLEMFGESFVTYIDIGFRSNIKGDISKAIYRFLESQRGDPDPYHILTLAKATNINSDLTMSELRKRTRKGLKELKTKKYLQRWMIDKKDMVHIWKTSTKQKQLDKV